MRVIGGTARGCRLLTPRGRAVRPTSDKVREAIFDVIGEEVKGAAVLDLFAGTGALGIEALSRGATSAVFVEEAAPLCRLIRSNLGATALASAARVIRGDVFRIVPRLARGGAVFDLVLADPPYAPRRRREPPPPEKALQVLAAVRIITPNGLAVMEHASEWPPPRQAGPLRRVSSKRYGKTGVVFYRCRHREPSQP